MIAKSGGLELGSVCLLSWYFLHQETGKDQTSQGICEVRVFTARTHKVESTVKYQEK